MSFLIKGRQPQFHSCVDEVLKFSFDILSFHVVLIEKTKKKKNKKVEEKDWHYEMKEVGYPKIKQKGKI